MKDVKIDIKMPNNDMTIYCDDFIDEKCHDEMRNCDFRRLRIFTYNGNDEIESSIIDIHGDANIYVYDLYEIENGII